MRYLLDSTLIIDHGKGDPAATATLARLFEDGHDLYTCDIVTTEVLSLGESPEIRHIEALLASLEYVSTSPSASRWAASSRRRRHLAGGKRALGDAIIAGVAEELGATIVTRNNPDFTSQGIPTLDY